MSLLRGISSCPTCHSPNKLTGVNSQTRLAKNRLLRFDKAKKKQLHRLEKTKLNNVEPKINHRKCKSTISCTVES